MGAKKKAKKGKGKKGKKGKLKEYLPNIYDVPKVPDEPRKAIPIVKVNLKLANPINYPMEFPLSIPISTKVMAIIDKIVELHGGGANNITICLHKFRPENPLSPTSSLMELGITQEGEINMYYDFRPVSHPLLS
ncbi:hypothetical protein SteCoe_4522 [Stentor coeruleus]|uniref:Ubiquitin-like domain-containing protein n=1 Tax=Stentor coeruleus TaxID=5963 RepID=A0A1R2CUE7_9CILI|nr:hypothetical protein SteCoe_4522 [Stentor coeruleus]